MLSVARRKDGRAEGLGLEWRAGGGGRGGGGGGRMEEDNELEEGEAYSLQEEEEEDEEDEDDSCIDPDSLSYIDEKLQNVLGHFQKDFEGGMSAENLGAKFGGYGSFLPTYQWSPSILSQPSPSKLPSQSSVRSPYNLSFEGTRQKASFASSASTLKNNATSTSLLDNSGKTAMFMSMPNNLESISQHNLFNMPTNSTDLKTLKVRIKVGPNDNLARNNAAIYSGLGLDISPSSSFEESPDGSGGISPESRPDESPKTIIQVMTCFSIPGGFLLSPLQDGPFHLTEGELLRKCRTGAVYKSMLGKGTILENHMLPTKELNGQVERNGKSCDKKGRPKEKKNPKDEVDIGTILNSEIDIETPAGQELVSNALNIRLLSGPMNDVEKYERHTASTAPKSDKKKDSSRVPKKALVKDLCMPPVLANGKQFESTERNMTNGVDNLDNGVTHPRGRCHTKENVLKRIAEQHDANDLTDPSYSLQTDGQLKIEKDFDTSHKNNHSTGYKWKNTQIADPLDDFKKISSQKATTLEEDREKILQSQDQTCDRKGKVKVVPSNSEPFREASKDSSSGNSSVAAKEPRKNFRAAVDCVEKKVKVPKILKESGGASYGKSCRGITGNGNAEDLENGMSYLDSNVDSKQKVGKPECDKAVIRSTQTLKERSSSRKVEVNLVSGVSHDDSSFTHDAPPPEATMAPPAAVVIQENWVCCDKCHKWRLLPYGTDPNSLPKKWQCSSLHWLPGLNNCSISEEETTRALHALYMAPVPEISSSNHSIPVSCNTLAGGVHQSQNITSNAQTLSVVGTGSTVKSASCLLNHSAGVRFSSSVKKDLHQPIKTQSLNDGGDAALEIMIKDTLGNSNNTDWNARKQKHKQKSKHKILCHSDGGDFIEKSKKHSKSKSKRDVDQDNVRASKKPKKESLQYADKDWHSKNDVIEMVLGENSNDDFSSKVVASNRPRYSDFSLAEDSSRVLKGNFSSSPQKSKDEYFTAVDLGRPDNMEVSLKKRKTKEWHENCNEKATVAGHEVVGNKVIFKRVPRENDVVTAKKAKISKSKGQVLNSSKTDKRKDKINALKKSVLPDNGEPLPDGMNDECQYLAGQRYELNTCQVNAGRVSNIDSLKRDMTFVQTSTAANSSSSKVSDSRRSKSHFQEAKGSPVESVSSSPVRIPNIEKPKSTKISAQADDMILGCKKRCSDDDVNGHFDHLQRGTNVPVHQQPKESNRTRDSSFGGTYDYQENDANRITDRKSDDLMNHVNKHFHGNADKNGYQDLSEVNTMLHAANEVTHKKPERKFSGVKEKPKASKSVLDPGKFNVSSSCGDSKDSHTTKKNISSRHEDNMHSVFSEARKEICSFEEKDEKDRMKKGDPLSKSSTARQDSSSNISIHEHTNANDCPALSIQHRGSDSGTLIVGAKSQVTPYHREKAQNHSCSEKNDQQELLSRLERSPMNLTSDNKHETNCHGPGVIASVLNESNLFVRSVVGTNETSVMAKQTRQPDTSGLHHSNLRHATPKAPDTSSPMRKDGHYSASTVLKEARDLKHTANRLKNEGLESESTNLYFEAALKFLHAASLMEPIDSTKHGEAAQMYSDTAKLCQFVAHEYERSKEMVGAALAYKCVEVAYLKAAYCKNPTANKDRHEVQAVLQMLPPGESPSSSASDVDNLNNNLGTLGKAILTKGVSSPQIAGNHAIAARLHPQVLRLLHYTNDLNFAFEATRKSQIAIAAATVSEKRLLDGLSSVRMALDFNFHNVEGLMRLVRIAMENIIH